MMFSGQCLKIGFPPEYLSPSITDIHITIFQEVQFYEIDALEKPHKYGSPEHCFHNPEP